MPKIKYLNVGSYPIIEYKEILSLDSIGQLSNNENKGQSINLQEATKNPRDSCKRDIVKHINYGKCNKMSRAELINELIRVGEMFHGALKSYIRGDEEFRLENLSVVECWDQPGYENKVHVDSQKKIWTGIIYLFGNSEISDGGTSFFEASNEAENSPGNLIYQAKPRINCGISFLSTKESFHSVEKSEATRHVLLLNYNRY